MEDKPITVSNIDYFTATDENSIPQSQQGSKFGAFSPGSDPPPTSSGVDNRSLSERFEDKNWKTRATAFEELKSELKASLSDDPLFDEYASFLPKMTSDSNAGALDAGIDAALLFIDMAPVKSVKPYFDKICSNILDKALSANRASTITTGKAVIMKMMEVDECTALTQVLLGKLSDKKPKVPPSCLEILKDALSAYGARAFPVKDIIGAMAAVFNGTNGAAREVAMLYIVDISKWIGKAPLNNLLEAIKPVQKEQFEKLFAEKQAEPTPTPSLWLRKDRPKPGDENSAVNTQSKAEVIDSRDFIEDIDLMKKLKNTEYSTLIVRPSPKLKSGSDVMDVINVIKGFLRQGHIQLQVSSLRILTLLSDGMRSDFGPIIRSLMESVILKSKEKRLIPEVHACLSNIVKYSLDVSDKMGSDGLKPLADALISCCEDSDPKVRDSCAISLAALAPLVKSRGRVAVDAHRALMGLEQSVPRVFKKIQLAMESSTLSTTTTTIPSSSTAATAVMKNKPTATATMSSSRMDDNDNNNEEESAEVETNSRFAPTTTTTIKPKVAVAAVKKPTKTATSTSTAAKKSTTGAAAGGAKKPSAAEKDKEDDKEEDLILNLEDAIEILSGLQIENWSDGIQKNMDSSKWQDKVDALLVIGKAIHDQNAGGQYSAPLVVYLKAKTGGLKISNISILKGVIQLACDAAKSAGDVKFSRSAAWELINAFGDKLSDKKTKDLVFELLTGLSEAVGPGFVVKRMKTVLDKTKAPLAHQHYLEWLKGAILEFGVGAFPAPFLGTFCQLEMENKVAGVRTAAVEVMGSLYFQLGPRLLSIAVSDDMKPALKTLLEAEFSRVGYDPSKSVQPLRAVKGEDGGASAESAIPRMEMNTAIDKNVLTELNFTDGKNSWQNRKAALEAVISACERSGHYMDAGKGGGDLMKSLKANLKPIAAAAIGHVISSLEIEQGAKLLRLVASGLLGGTGDNKKMAVTQCREGVPGDPTLLGVLISPIVEALINIVGRQELLQWLLTHSDNFKADKADYNELAAPLVASLQDKTAAVRSLAEQLLTVLLARTLMSKAALDKASRDLPPATKRTLQAPLDRMMAAYGTKKTPSATASTTTAATTGKPGDNDNMSIPLEIDVEVEEEEVHRPPSGSDRMPLPMAAPSSSKAMSLDKTSSSSARTMPPPAPVDDPVASSATSKDSPRWFLKKCNRTRRVEEFFRVTWPQPPDDPGEPELLALRNVWEPLITSDLAAVVFQIQKPGTSVNQDLVIGPLNELLQQLEGPYAIQHTDLLLRYGGYCLGLRETATGLLRVLQFFVHVFEKIRNENAQSERHRMAFKATVEAAGEVLAPNRLCAVLLQGLSSKNKKSRIVCLEEIQRVVEGAGIGALGKNGTKEIGVYLESKDNDTGGRHACLELIYTLYVSLGNDSAKLMKLLGAEKSATLIDERIRQKSKSGHSQSHSQSQIARSLSSLPSSSTGSSTGAGHEERINRPSSANKTSSLRASGMTVSHANTITGNTAASGSTSSIRPDESKILRGGGRSISPIPPDRNTSHMSPVRSATTGTNNAEHGSPDDISPFKLESLTPVPARRPVVVTDQQVRAQTSNRIMSDIASLQSLQVLSTPNRRDRDLGLPRGGDGVGGVPGGGGGATGYRNSTNTTTATMGRSSMKESNLSAFKAEAARQEHHMEGMYIDVIQKIDVLLLHKDVVREDSPIQEDAKDYLKMLHSIVTGEWSAEVLPEDDEALRRQSIPLLYRVLRSVERAFECPALPIVPPSVNSLSIDVGLASVALATLFALVRRKDVIDRIPEACLAELISECLRRIVDTRLTNTALDEESNDVAQQIVRALNLILIKAGTGPSSGTALSAMLIVLFNCIPESNGEPRMLPLQSGKPAAKLMLKILNDEMKQNAPFSPPAVDIKKLLASLNTFFTRQSQSNSNPSASEDNAHQAAKTLLTQVVQVLGGHVVLNEFDDMNIPSTSFTYRHVARIAHITLPDIVTVSGGGGGVTSPEVQARVLALIDDITSCRDKMVPIRELHILIKMNPQMNVNQYLQRISAAFRKFVLDTLAKLDAENQRVVDANINMHNIPGLDRTVSEDSNLMTMAMNNNNSSATNMANYTSNSSNSNSTNMNMSMNMVAGSRVSVGGGADAFRMIESMKAPKYRLAHSVSSSIDATPVSKMDRVASVDYVRGSLMNLTANLDLNNNAPLMRSNSNSSNNGGSSNSSSGGGFSSEDFRAKLNRIQKTVETKFSPDSNS
eukprot:gene127-202_t